MTLVFSVRPNDKLGIHIVTAVLNLGFKVLPLDHGISQGLVSRIHAWDRHMSSLAYRRYPAAGV